ncbi:uncharacterized protein FA14DRAFT_38160 [Meira miltonrushii]|uniref:Fibronectin type-III domain-containing protein n=1 Tax=Meira miltonrushii TaxID=1280837 RepID=A0A316VBW7_9BASI|nr:uncharacterized protein FA14DRAFT_38160 [Meira miltonrushii]PWN35157.1 hypothetical protein FA14DRAFT_38160 [Meira miltonrushii]
MASIVSRLRLPLLVAAICIQSVLADLEFTYSYVRECTPLNVTWTPQSDAYPYSVYIMGIGAQVQSYQINSNYQPGASQLTYQYSVPQKTDTFQALMIAVVDSKGNGNSSAVLTVNSNPNIPATCSVYAVTNAWFYASDSVTGNPADRPQCGNLKYYPVGALRGTSPFSYSIIPVQGQPMTVNIPSSATLNQTYFVFQSPLAFKQGTQFYQMASDATGSGSGGGSPIQEVGAGKTNACLQSNYKIEGLDTSHALPVGQIAASFDNLPGAIANANPTGSSGSQVGGLIGGIIGAALGVGGILLIIGLFLVYRRRQKRKREMERKEQPQFIDLDEDVFDPASRRRRSNPNSGNGVRQSYSVSPFTYQDAGSNDGMALMVAGEGNGTLNSIGAPTSDYGASTLRHTAANEGLGSPLSDYGYGLSSTSNSASQALLRNGSGDPWNSHPLERNQNSVYSSHLPTGSTASSSSGPFGMSAAVGGHDFANSPQSPTEGTMSSASAYVLRARNVDEREQQNNRRSMGRSQNDTIASNPSKSNATMEEEERRRIASSRFVQHQDAGRLAVAPGTEEEELQEDVPPEYGQWLTHQPNTRKQ